MPRKKPQYEQDGEDVLEFLMKFPRMRFSRSEIARGSGVPDNHRIIPAICLARAAAELCGARVENFKSSPARKNVRTLRYLPAGMGDADVAEDANRSSRSAITHVENARRACNFAGKTHQIEMSVQYALVGNAFGACLSNISSIEGLSAELWKKHQENLALAARVAAYEAAEQKRASRPHDLP